MPAVGSLGINACDSMGVNRTLKLTVTVKAEREVFAMKKRKMLMRRAFCSAMALALVFSTLVVPQGAITAYAEGNSNTADQITVRVDTSDCSATQIKNGNFETPPWEDFYYNQTKYVDISSSIHQKTIDSAIPNGVDMGWNTTENKTYKGGLFEVWDVQNLPAETGRTFPEAVGRYFIEMNANNPAALYQDLSTQGGDVIKWTLQHAARNGSGCEYQRMYVTIGAPERDGGDIVPASGVNNNIDTKIQEAGKAEYRYNGIKVGSESGVAFANQRELEGLSVSKSVTDWSNVAGIYVVPEGQDVTRFAFCADATDSSSTDSNTLSCGNFLDNITFSTLIGSIEATKQMDGDVEITGYWGDEDPNKKLIVKIGSEEHEIDMKEVSKKNFVINVPERIIEAAGASDVQVYHEDYRTATTTVTIRHEHSWNYTAGNSGNSGKLYAYCSSTQEPVCSWNGAENKLALTLTAPDMTYTGERYTGASLNADEKLAWEAAGLTVPNIQYEGTDGTDLASSEIAPIDEGSYEASITEGGATTKVPFKISKKDIAGAGITVTINQQNYTHDGAEKTPTITVKDGETDLVSGTDYTISGAVTGSAVRAYVITVTGVGKYKGTVQKTWEIIPASITSFEKYEYSDIYDGMPHCSTVSAIVQGDAEIEITYSTSENSGYNKNPPQFTEVGTYTVYYKISQGETTLLSGTLTVTIKAKPQYQIILENDGNGTASAAVAGVTVTSTEAGNEVTLTATANSGYQFKQWSEYDEDINLSGNQFQMPERDVTIKAEFEAAPGGGSGGGSGSGGSGGSGSGSGGSGSGSGSSGGSGGSSSGGAGGTQPTTPTENFDIPVKNENTVKVEAEIKDGTANVSEITNDTIDKVVNNKDAGSKVDTITIDLSSAKQEVTGVTLSKESVKTLAETTAQKDNGIDTATIELSKATVELDHKALETLAEQAKGTQIQLVVEDKDRKALNTAQQTSLSQHQVATTFEAYFTSDGQRIHDFKGGKAVVSIDFTPETGKDTSYYHMVYVAESGEMTRYKTKYENRKLMFTTTHFSDYAVIYDTGEKNETEKPKEKEEKEDSSDTGDKITMDTSYSKLRLRVPTSTRTTNVLMWTNQTGADGYVIYGALCNTKKQTYTLKELATIKNTGTTTWTHKSLKSGTYYKYCIKAYKLVNGKKVWLAKSKVVHATTTGGKYGNAKTVKVNKTSISLTTGKTFTIKAEQVLKDKPIAGHQNIKYESSNTKVASVTGKGVIKAKKKGNCYIYVYAQNGMYKRIKVVVS